MLGVFNVTEETLNAVGRPILVSAQTFVHTFALAISLAVYGGRVSGIDRLLMGFVGADRGGALFGLIALGWACRACFLGKTGSIQTVSAAPS